MTTLAAGQSATVVLRDGGVCSIASNGGLATAVFTPTVGIVQTVQIGPLPCRQSFSAPEGAVLTITSQSAAIDYDQLGGNTVVATTDLTGGIKTLAVLTQAQYDALVAAGTLDATTEYNIVAA